MARRPLKRPLGEGNFTMKGGSMVPREWFEDEPTQKAIDEAEALSPEEVYEFSLRMGLPRDPAVEERIDMTKVDLEGEPF